MWFWVVALILAGCQNANVGTGGSSCSGIGSCLDSGSGSGSGSGIGNGGAESPYSLSLKSYWENDNGKVFPTSHAVKLIQKVGGNYLKTGMTSDLSNDSCQIAPGTKMTSSADERQIVCGVAIPETQLFYSSLDLVVTVSKDADCDVVNYDPYGYLAGDTATFKSRWQTTALDCTVDPIPASCYSGPAIDISGWPLQSGGLYHQIYDKTKSFSDVYSIPSANSKLRGDNRWTSYRPSKDHIIQNWNWECVKKGSSLSYTIALRIMPERDNPFNPGATRYLG
jgi:hypothetical protein